MTTNTQQLFNTMAQSRINAAITTSATSLTLIPGGIVNFLPGWVSGKEFYCTLVDASANREIIKVTDISDHTFTIARGQDSSTARAWPIGTVITQRCVAANYDRFIQKLGFRAVAYNPNGVISAAYPGEKVVQAGAQSCQFRWWKNVTGTQWQLIAGDMCSAYSYDTWPTDPDWWPSDDGWGDWPYTDLPEWWPSGEAESLDGNGYVETPKFVGGWVAHFDNTEWETSPLGTYGTDQPIWDGSQWGFQVEKPIGGLDRLGTWTSGYRPTKVRLTLTNVEGTYVVGLYDTNDDGLGGSADYTSLDEIDLTFGDYNIAYFGIEAGAGGNEITNIEFYFSGT